MSMNREFPGLGKGTHTSLANASVILTFKSDRSVGVRAVLGVNPKKQDQVGDKKILKQYVWGKRLRVASSSWVRAVDRSVRKLVCG